LDKGFQMSENTPIVKKPHPRDEGFTPEMLAFNESVRHSAVHLNGHLLCAIDTETSGLTPGKNDIIQIAIIPLQPDYSLSKIFKPFSTLIKPKRPENVDPDLPGKYRKKFLEACIHGIDPWTCVDRLTEWFYALKLPEKKKIVPLGHNYLNFDKPFIQEWLGGPLSYDEFFRHDVRDTMISALYLNDCFDSHNLKIPFPKYNLTFIASCLGIPHPDAHDALADAFTASQVYKGLMHYYNQFKII
jgi:DNA polymerase III epsilon subunit-like protein